MERPRFLPAAIVVPHRLDRPQFRLEPLTVAHNALDYAALMESRAMLRLWSGSTWPTDDFTLADNQTDLAWHAREHRERIAFTYTVLDPAGERCLGCVYVKSLPALLATEAAGREWPREIGDFEAAIRFWVTAPRLADRLDARLLAALQGWFADAWPFRRVFCHTRTVNQQQLSLFRAAGMTHACTLPLPGRGGAHQFWEMTLA